MCELKYVFGFDPRVRRGLTFHNYDTLFYPSGRIGVFHSLKDNTQCFWTIPDAQMLSAVAWDDGKTRLLMASRGTEPKISIYDFKTGGRRILPNPEGMLSSYYVDVSFCGEGMAAALAGAPSWLLVLWLTKKKQILTVHRPFSTEVGAKAYKFCLNPKDSEQVVVFGLAFLRLYCLHGAVRFLEFPFRDLERSGIAFHSVVWTEPETNSFAASTSDGRILWFRQTIILKELSIEQALAANPRMVPQDMGSGVSCFLFAKTGVLLCTFGASVLCLHETEDGVGYSVVSILHIPDLPGNSSRNSDIVQLELNSAEDKLAVATDDGRILSHSFSKTDLLWFLGYDSDLSPVLEYRQHRGRVRSVDTSISVPIQATVSESSVILWNYSNRKLLLCSDFGGRRISIHPLGIQLLVAFTEQVILYNVLQDSLSEVRGLQCSEDPEVAFSPGGHNFCVSNASSLTIYDTFTFKELATLIRSGGAKVQRLLWNKNSSMVFADSSGRICVWNIGHSSDVWEFFIPKATCSALATDGDNLYVASSDCKITLFTKEPSCLAYQVVGECGSPAEVTVMLVHGMMLLAGTRMGTVVGFPLQLNGLLFEKTCHHRSVLHMVVYGGGNRLHLAGRDGTFSIWKVGDAQEKTFVEEVGYVLVIRKEHEKNVEDMRKLQVEFEKLKRQYDHDTVKRNELEETEKSQTRQNYHDIERELEAKVLALAEQKHDMLLDTEWDHLQKITTISQEKEENLLDFEEKLSKEKEHYKNLLGKRNRMKEIYERRIHDVREAMGVARAQVTENERRNMLRLEESQKMLQKELQRREKLTEENQQLAAELEELKMSGTQAAKESLALELQELQKKCNELEAQMEEEKALLSFERELQFTVEAEFAEKKREEGALKNIGCHLRESMGRVEDRIRMMTEVLEEKGRMVQKLESTESEERHLFKEMSWKWTQENDALADTETKLSAAKNELEQLTSIKDDLNRQVRLASRQKALLSEKLKSTEKHMVEITQKLFSAREDLERYCAEFEEGTARATTPTLLRWALLRIYKTRALRGVMQQKTAPGSAHEMFFRQRDHFEALINTVQNRTQEVQETFRKNYIKLAKENSDWATFAEELRSDLRNKKERASSLERALENGTEIHHRLEEVFIKLEGLKREEGAELQKRIKLLKEQQEELRRLHGLVVVDEKGIVSRRM